MPKRFAIIDFFVDEPACFGVPPFVSPYPRYIFGALIDAGIAPERIDYLTVDMLRDRDFALTGPYEWAFVVGGAVVPGKYLGSRIGTLAEIGRIIGANPRQHFAVGGLISRVTTDWRGNARPVLEDIEFFAGRAAAGSPADGRRTPGDISRWAIFGAEAVTRHPDYPNLICEIETFRGCPRETHCSFCSEGTMGAPEFRLCEDILAEIEALGRCGITRFRLGRQADILQYGTRLALWRNGFPRPEPEAVRKLLAPLAEKRKNGDIRVLNVDNANPGTIASYPEESAEILGYLAGTVTPGDTLALGIESFDDEVIGRNGLKVTFEEALHVIELINRIGGVRSGGIPTLLPGINLLHGLAGETEKTFELNYRALCEIRDRGLLVRRINIRKVQPFPGTPLHDERPVLSRSAALRFEYYRDRIRSDIDIPMMKSVFPAGTVIKESLIHELKAGYSYGKQIASYSVTAKIPAELEPKSFHDLVVVNHRERSIIALPVPVKINTLSRKALELISGIGKNRASEIILRRPVENIDSVNDLLKDVDPALAGMLSP